jgi:hypothetical protein
MLAFDASLDLTVHTVSAGIPPAAAVACVRTAVEGLPGAPLSGGDLDEVAALMSATALHAPGGPA